MRPAWRTEALLVAGGVVLVLLGSVLQPDGSLTWPAAAAYPLAAASSALLLARTRAPIGTLAATTVCGMLVAPLGMLTTPFTTAPAVIASYVLARHTAGRPAALAGAAGVVMVVLVPFCEPDLSWEDTSRLLIVAVSPVIAVLLGRSRRHQQAYLTLTEERAQRAEADRENEARRRVAEERVRIARDLHDLVAQQITVANAQANVAAHLFDARPDEARSSIAELVGTTSQALNELRATVGFLRAPEEAISTEPAPGLERLPTLLDSFRRAGLDAQLRQEGTPTSLPPALDLTSYRIIAEALTNVTKHSSATTADVDLTWAREQLTITVTNTDGPTPTRKGHTPGYGLVGLGERAAAVGGTLRTEAGRDGGFVLTACLPIVDRADRVSVGPFPGQDRTDD